MNKQEIKDRNKIIREGINDFLDDHGIDFSSQNMERTAKHLFKTFEQDNSISATSINDFLSRIFEYNEGTISSMNSEDGSDYEELLVSLVVAAEKKTKNPAKIWFIILLGFAILIGAVLLLQPSPQNTVISITQAQDLKSLVADIVKLEKKNNNKTTHQAIWNIVKNLENITQYGFQASYKDFSETQYLEAKKYLNEWAIKAKNSTASPNKDKTLTFTASNIRVIDGDTFSTPEGKFRLWGVDAFELKQMCFDNDKNSIPCGVKAKETLQEIFNKAQEIKCIIATKDRYKRSVVKCYIDGIKLGTLLTQSGWVLDYEKYSGGEFKDSEAEAKASLTGVWNGCFVNPWDYRHKDNLDICK